MYFYKGLKLNIIGGQTVNVLDPKLRPPLESMNSTNHMSLPP